MTHKIILLFFIVVLASTVAHGQILADKDTMLYDFSTDSTGCFGKRLKYIDTITVYFPSKDLTPRSTPKETKTATEIYIGGRNLNYQKADSLYSLIGQCDVFIPTKTITKKVGNKYISIEIHQGLYYLTNRHCSNGKYFNKVLFITIVDNKVENIEVLLL